MRAVTFQAPGEVLVEEVPEPECSGARDAIVRVEATGVCGSDLHIYHGRVQIEPGFTIGHEYVGTVIAAGEDVRDVQVGDRVLGCFQTACGHCFFCRAGWYHRCAESRTFGHGAALGSLPGHPGGAGARAERRSRAAQGARRHERRRRAVRRRRHGHRLPRRGGERSARRRCRRGARARAGRAVRRAGGEGGRRCACARHRLGGGAPCRRRVLRGGAGPPHRAGRACARARAHGGPRGGRVHRRGRRSARAGDGALHHARSAVRCSASACTPSARRCTWACCGSRRSRCVVARPT